MARFRATAQVTTPFHPLRRFRAGLDPARHSQPRPRAASWTSTPLADFCNCHRARAHRASDHSSRGARHFDALRRLDGGPSRLRAARHPNAFGALELAPEGARRTGRRATSQRARRGAEADSKPDVHLLSPSSAPRGLDLISRRAQRPRPASDPPRERHEPSAEPRCLPSPGTAAGALPPAGPSRSPRTS